MQCSDVGMRGKMHCCAKCPLFVHLAYLECCAAIDPSCLGFVGLYVGHPYIQLIMKNLLTLLVLSNKSK